MNTENPKESIKVSIVTPSYNQGQFIEATILSVLNQTYKNIQYIIIDGGSDDETMDVVNRYKDKIDIIIHEKDKGQSDAINKGFRLSVGQLVGWINSDDILYPTCVEEIVDLYTNHPDGAIYYGNQIDFLDAIGNVTVTKTIAIPNRKYLLNNNFDVIQQSSFYRRDLLELVNYCDENIHYCMDLDLWLRLLEHGNIYSVENKPLAGFRFWEGTKTTNGGLLFSKNIKMVLARHGGGKRSKNVRRLIYEMFKIRVKSVLLNLGILK